MTEETPSAVKFTFRGVDRQLQDGTFRLKIDIEPGDITAVTEMFVVPGIGTEGAMARITPESSQKAAQDETIRKYGDSARELFRLGFFQVPEVLAAIGTDKDFLAWIRLQPSAFSKEFSEYVEDGTGRCIASHVRRVSLGAGTAIKPPFAAIPATFLEHDQVHKGDPEFSIEVQEKKLKKYQDEWAKLNLSEWFNVESLSEVAPEDFLGWAEAKGVERYLPREYREV